MYMETAQFGGNKAGEETGDSGILEQGDMRQVDIEGQRTVTYTTTNLPNVVPRENHCTATSSHSVLPHLAPTPVLLAFSNLEVQLLLQTLRSIVLEEHPDRQSLSNLLCNLEQQLFLSPGQSIPSQETFDANEGYLYIVNIGNRGLNQGNQREAKSYNKEQMVLQESWSPPIRIHPNHICLPVMTSIYMT
ncbi:hypothetical protein BDZ94DRAFT_1240055 [Collybia nuda]|uniref:Uncharacterized protein n=1 Tax=Collybia nuda TaxID=64659 RepID=A0A9P6CDN1_9AGAR|nr:hypothetical protein BDZ94DRAFT_1240055 [Collybia nuda]